MAGIDLRSSTSQSGASVSSLVVGGSVADAPILVDHAQPSAYQTVRAPAAIVAIRTDDIFLADYQSWYPDLQSRGLVGGCAVVRAAIGQSSRCTQAQLLEMQAYGIELMAHTRSHTYFNNDDVQFVDEVITATAEMRAMGFYLQNFVQPGVWNTAGGNPAGDLSYQGDRYWFGDYGKINSDPGRMIQQNFLASEAYLNDGVHATNYVRPIPAMQRHGVNHFTGEQSTYAALKAATDMAIEMGGTLEVLAHAYRVYGGTGYIPVTQWRQWLDYVAARRDAGVLTVMTPTAALMAQRGPYINLLPDTSFDVLRANSAASSWTVTGATAVTGGRTSSALQCAVGQSGTQTINANNLRTVRVECWAKAASGTGKASMRVRIPNSAVYNSDQTASTTTLSSTVWTKLTVTVGASPPPATSTAYGMIIALSNAGTGADPTVLFSDVVAYAC